MSERKGLERRLFWLYEGFGTGPYIFRWVLLALDAAAVAFFLWSPTQDRTPTFYIIDVAIGVFILLDLAARFWISRPRHRFFLNPFNIADIIVLISLFLPMLFYNLAFLRILRAIRLIRAFTFLRDMKGISGFLKSHKDIIDHVVNLVVFILIMTSLVYATQVAKNEAINSYLDAMYMTVATLTTTGFGDIVLVDWDGKILAILTMVLGISLFLRLVQALVRPTRVKIVCTRCGLAKHEPDAVHCRYCGELLPQDSKGED